MLIKDYILGIVTVLIIAVISYFISMLHASFDALVISILIGMLFGNLIGDRASFKKGTDGAIKVFLPVGIALYGSQLVFNDLRLSFVLTVFLVFLCLFVLTLLVSNFFNIDRKLAILLASGLSVCGASAIAVISPLIGARKEDTSISVISVMMLGLSGMILYPVLANVLSLGVEDSAFFAGATLPMLGQVKVASLNISRECFETALKIKLIRISFLFFLVTTAILLSGKAKKKVKIPWFIIVFIVSALIVNFTRILEPMIGYFRNVSSFFLSSALAAIGFSVDFETIIEKGAAPLAAIFLSWGVILFLISVVVSLI